MSALDRQAPLAAQARPEPLAAGRAFVTVEGVTKKFGSFLAVDDVSFDIAEGEIFSLLGGSGCGKTTLLRMLAGFEAPTRGRILIDGQDMTDAPPYERPVNMMFQSYALFPHMSVEKNVGYGLKHERMTAAQRRDRVAEMLDLVQLTDFAQRKPHQISGGQRQRVALARALARAPKLLLLDEPLAALDKKLRENMQIELRRLQREVGITFVMVTHDQEEALTMSDRLVVMSEGEVRQVGSQRDLYERPADSFVAGFVGRSSFISGTMAGDTLTSEGGLSIKCADSVSGPAMLALRPERVWVGHEPLGELDHRTGEHAGKQVRGLFHLPLHGLHDLRMRMADQRAHLPGGKVEDRAVVGIVDV